MENRGSKTKPVPLNKNPRRFALIIGAMKGGTTSLFDILSQHPKICSSKEKEPDFFIEDRDEMSRKEYLALWDCDDNLNQVLLESSVAYSKAPYIAGVPERISKCGLGDFRFIYMLREPLSRIESQVRHGLFAGWGKSLDVGLPKDAIDFSRYAMQLEQYLKYFPREHILLVTLEEFKENPHEVLARICKFLDIDSNFLFHDVEKPRNSGDFFNAPPIVARVTQGGFGQFVAHTILPTKIKNILRNILATLGKREQKKSDYGRWRLNSEERIHVLQRLSDDLKKLESEYDINIRKYWNLPLELFEKSV